MRLLKVGLWGYRRFEAADDMDVGGDVVAIVGPNEAGKTSFLDALLHLNAEGEFGRSEFTRNAVANKGEACVRALFALDDGDKDALADLPEAADVRRFTVFKRESGSIAGKPEPLPQRDLGPRRKALSLGKQVERQAWTQEEEQEDVRDALHAALDMLDAEAQTLEPEWIEPLTALRELLLSKEDLPPRPRKLAERLEELEQHESAPHPTEETARRLLARRPQFVKFEPEDRDLASSHNISEGPSKALQNLARLARLDLDALRRAEEGQDHATRAELINAANDELKRVFYETWNQTKIAVELYADAGVLHVFATNKPPRLIDIEQRSAGLRQFVALIAFVESQQLDRKPVLLVDEAEAHLHYDAQADLVNVFAEQDAVDKVVYTTHSAGCLPQDLGSGVRMIEATGKADEPQEEWDRSRVRNYFWTGRDKHGFSPLFIGMGATTFAFAAARCALVGEGITDAMLLPTLFREAADLRTLTFQVAPGLSETSKESVRELDLIAARVAYLVDGDEGGLQLRQDLLDAGVPETRIVVLTDADEPLTVEHLVKPKVLLRAANAELDTWHGVTMPEAALSTEHAWKSIKDWCKNQTNANGEPLELGKRAVAHQLLEFRHDDTLVDSRRRSLVKRVHRRTEEILQTPLTATTRSE